MMMMGFAALNPSYNRTLPRGHHMNRRRVLAGAACLVGAALAAKTPAMAQDYPNQSIRMIVPFGPGGGSDIVARIVARRVQEERGQPVVIQKKAGAGAELG